MRSALLLIALFCLPLASPAAQSMHSQTALSTGWLFRQGGGTTAGRTGEWLPASVPGCVHLDLLRNHRIPEPFFRDDEAKLQWIENAPWEYKAGFSVSAAQLAARHLELAFDGLDTTATVSINDKEVLQADNMFRSWTIDLKPLVHAGQNSINVAFTPAADAGEALAAADPAEADLHLKPKSYLRKAAYEFGWDWGPRFVTYGIWKPVRLVTWDNVRIQDLFVRQNDISAAVAHLGVQVRVEAATPGAAELALHYGIGGATQTVTERVLLHAGTNQLIVPVNIPQPRLWYPAGYGPQTIYGFTADLRQGSALEDERSVRTGLRSVRLDRHLDKWGRSFQFVVNGIPIFAKGADVIPFDSFPTRVTLERYRRILGSARDANMNMIRLWGGGYYESDQFYQLCDELGLMVWQDFMYSDAWYPGTAGFKQNMQHEATEQIERLRNHASLVLWSGNNEVEQVLNAYLGGESEAARLQVWKNYLTEFSGILPATVARLDPQTPYWPSSPSADYEPTSDSFQSGDAHDWSIWHGRAPFSDFTKHNYRFDSEFGFQSFPELRTVEAFTTPSDRTSIFTPVMLAHQKNNEGNSIIQEYLLRDYPQPKDFDSFLYVSQVLQAEGIKIGVEHMRTSRPRTMGALFWQLNDCWPVASWSSIDYYGRWKALQYYARRFYTPLLVSLSLDHGSVRVDAVSDLTTDTHATLRIRRMRLTGQMLSDRSISVNLPPLSDATYDEDSLSSIAQNAVPFDEQFVAASLIVGGKTVSQNLIYLEPTRQVHLPQAAIHSVLSSAGGTETVTLISSVLARDVYLTFGDLDVEPSDNYFDLLPGEPVTVQLTSTASADAIRQAMKVTSLVDAFAPIGAEPAKAADTTASAKP